MITINPWKIRRLNIAVLLAISTCFSSSIFGLTYSTNFMWINKAKTIDRYVFPEIRRKAGWDIEVVPWMSHWLKANPKGDFLFWYDKDTVSPEQIRNTEKLFSKLQNSVLSGGKLQLKDIRESPIVSDKKNWQYFSQSTPFYLRVDLLRVALGLDYLEKCQGECAYVYADVDKGLKADENGNFSPLDLSEKGLFESQLSSGLSTIQSLKNNGLVMRSGPENSFFIISNHKPNMLKALDIVVLQSNFKRIKRLLDEEKMIRATLPTKELREAPLDKNFNKVAGFDRLTKDQRQKLRKLGTNFVNLVFHTMILGPLMLYYHFLEDTIALVPNMEVMDRGGYAELFSLLKMDQSSSTPLLNSKNSLIVRFYKKDVSDETSEKGAARLTMTYLIPMIDIGGSKSQSFYLDW